MSNKYEEHPTLDEMRFELSQFTKITPDIQDGYIRAMYRCYKGAIDPQRPSWSRREQELIFEHIADGNGDAAIFIQDLRNLIQRNAREAFDYMGEWLDSDENSL